MTELDHHPEIQALCATCAEHRRAIRAALEEWHELTTVMKPTLMDLYNKHFGVLEIQRQRLALQYAELFRRVELLSIKIQRGEKLTEESVAVVNRVVDAEYARVRQRFSETIIGEGTKPPPVNTSSEELVKMYRVLAKQVHPDAKGTAADATSWHQVQQAYAQKDAPRLRALITALGADEPVDQDCYAWDLDRWRNEEMVLGTRRRIEERKLERLRNEDPFAIAVQLEDPVWIENHTKELNAELDRRTAEIAEQQKIYAELTNGLVTADQLKNVTQEQQQFAQDFMENTYFGNR